MPSLRRYTGSGAGVVVVSAAVVVAASVVVGSGSVAGVVVSGEVVSAAADVVVAADVEAAIELSWLEHAHRAKLATKAPVPPRIALRIVCPPCPCRVPAIVASSTIRRGAFARHGLVLTRYAGN
jgi:hypothetical protein